MDFAKPTCFKIGISLMFWMGCFLIVSASNSRTLQKPIVSTFEKKDKTLLEFKKFSLDDSKINFEPNSLKLYSGFFQTGNQLSFYSDSKKNYLIKRIYSIQDVIDSFFDTKKKSGRNFNFDQANYFFSRHLNLSSKLSFTDIFEKEKNENFFILSLSNSPELKNSQNKISDTYPLQIDNWGETILTLVVSLIFVILLIYLIAYLYKKFFSNRFSTIKGNVQIRQISSYYVGPKQKVIVFDFDGRKFACGVTPSSINLIAELYDENEDKISNVENGVKNFNKKEKKNSSKFLKTLEPELKKI